MILRSFLFTPANHRRRVLSALTGQADAVILDLEDAVSLDQKEQARDDARATIQGRAGTDLPALYVRINGRQTPFFEADLRAVVGAGLDGILLPKAESAGDVQAADMILGAAEREQGLAPGVIEIIPLIETVRGLEYMEEVLTSSSRIRLAAFGSGDFTLDAGMEWQAGHEGVLWARIQTVLRSRLARKEPPIDTVFIDLKDLEGFRRHVEQGRRLGFQGLLCIHPSQVEVANVVYTPEPKAVAQAHRILEAWKSALERGEASIQLDGLFIDYPIAEKARRLVDRARQIEARQRN